MFQSREAELIKKFSAVEAQVDGKPTRVGAAYVRHLVQYKYAEEGSAKQRGLGVTLAEERELVRGHVTPEDFKDLVGIIGKKFEDGYSQQSVREALDKITRSLKGAKNVAA